jgi:hypothetical protein
LTRRIPAGPYQRPDDERTRRRQSIQQSLAHPQVISP